MEGKKPTGSSPSSTSSLASELFGKESAGESSSSSTGLFSSVFLPPSEVMGGDSYRPDIFVPSRKQEQTSQAWTPHNASAGGNRQNSLGKELNKERTSSYNGDKSDTCFLGSSLHYGGQDVCNICNQPRGSQTSSSGSSYNYKKDEDSGNSCIDSKGNWWEGSLYY